MRKLSSVDKVLFFLSGLVFLGAVIFVASLTETRACPPPVCPGCPPACLKLRCTMTFDPSDKSCKGDKNRYCHTAGGPCRSDPNFERPYPAYYFYCGETCKRRDGGGPYSKTYLSCWGSGRSTGYGVGKIGYRFECLPDPWFLGQGADCCDGAVKDGYFETRIKVVVCLYMDDRCPGVKDPAKIWQREWYRRRTITREKRGDVPCQGVWTGDPVDPGAVLAEVEYSKDYDCNEYHCHNFYVQVAVYVTFKQSGLALDQEPGGEVFVGRPVFDCLE